jgi:hypothetical protein
MEREDGKKIAKVAFRIYD